MKTLEELRREPHWSYSSINAILNICGLQWAFRSVYGVEPEFTPLNLVVGKTFHRACEFAARARQRGRRVAAAELADLFGDVFTTEIAAAEPQVRFDDDIDTAIATGRGMTAAFLDAWPAEEDVVAVSMPFCADVAGIAKPLIGELDVVVSGAAGLEVVDWKTAARRWSAEKAKTDLQPTCYLYAWRCLQPGGDLPGFRFDVVTKSKQPGFQQLRTTRSSDDFDRLVQLINTVEAVVRHELFWPHEQSFYCGSCPYHGPCRTWHRNRRTLILTGLAA
jgi:hypothetical protein